MNTIDNMQNEMYFYGDMKFEKDYYKFLKPIISPVSLSSDNS